MILTLALTLNIMQIQLESSSREQWSKSLVFTLFLTSQQPREWSWKRECEIRIIVNTLHQRSGRIEIVWIVETRVSNSKDERGWSKWEVYSQNATRGEVKKRAHARWSRFRYPGGKVAKAGPLHQCPEILYGEACIQQIVSILGGGKKISGEGLSTSSGITVVRQH